MKCTKPVNTYSFLSVFSKIICIFLGQHITLQSLLIVLKNRELFQGCIESLRRVLRNMGFTYKKDNPRRGLMELTRIAVMRTEFLQKYMKNVNSTKPSQFVYLDETWMFQNGTATRSWQDSSVKSVKSIRPDGKR